MKHNNINPKTDVNMVNNIDFAATAGAFGRYIKERLFFY
jgi:NitT/TauT family transport system substrate-binding protein